jgi:hypothetical protein
MTRNAVEDGFDQYLSKLVTETYNAFDVAAVLRGSRSGGSRAVSKLLKNSKPVERHVVRPKLREYQRTLLRQFEPVLDYAEDGDAGFDAYADSVLSRDLYWNSIRSGISDDRRETIRSELLDRQRAFGDDLAPLIAAESDSFWGAVAESYDREQAISLVESHFVFSGPLESHVDAFVFELEIDPGDILGGLARALPTLTVEFTDEALRAMQLAEQEVVPEAKSDLEDAYESATHR